MFCGTCGTENDEFANFCSACGGSMASSGGGSGSFGSVGYGDSDIKPENQMVKAILVTLFCCLPLGVVAIMNASKVDAEWNAGNHEIAYQKAAEAQKWIKISFFSGLIIQVLNVMLTLANS